MYDRADGTWKPLDPARGYRVASMDFLVRSGSKASYELRKICIDHIYQRFGTEKEVSISGDDIRTISRYYADPAQPNRRGQGHGPDRVKL